MRLSIYDNYTGLKREFDFFEIDYNYKSCSMLLICICHRGKATYKFNLHEIEMEKGTFLMIAPDIPFYIIESTPDFHIDVIAVEDFITLLEGDKEYELKLDQLLHKTPCVKISERKRCMAHIMLSYMKHLLAIKKNEDLLSAKYTEKILESYLYTMFLEACKIIDDNQKHITIKSRSDSISENFFRCVRHNFMTNRNVSFYASELGISAKHLALVINRKTGRSPLEWINDFSLMQAKKYLRGGDKAVHEIGYDLGFSSPSHFCKFFKDHTGLTPLEFSKEFQRKEKQQE